MKNKQEEKYMISISKVVYAVIAIVIAVIIVSTVLIPTVAGLDFTGNANASMYTTLLGVVCTLGIIIPVMMAVKVISGGKD